jgi:hypothetical protein
VSSLLLTCLFVALAQDPGGELRGIVIIGADIPVSGATIQARVENGNAATHVVTTASDGSYRLTSLPAGRYTLMASTTGSSSTEIRHVHVVGRIQTLPAVRLEIGHIADCGMDPRPGYYQLTDGWPQMGAVAGTVTSEAGVKIANAKVTLFVNGKGMVASQQTNKDGSFSFAGLPVRSEEYVLSIDSRGYFSEELRRLTVSPGLESVYVPITMEACGPGHCQPHLKRLKVIGGCA